MKQVKKRLLCLLLIGVMAFSLAACGKDTGGDPNLIKLNDYELLYKGACIMEDYDGSDALVLTLDFTNNGKESASYLWSVIETATQNDTELERTTVYTDYETLASVTDSQWEEVAPGATIEIQTAFALIDATSKVEVSFGQLFGSKSGKITVDPSTLSRESAGSGTAQPIGTGDPLLDWWNGSWYGWWTMSACSGQYEGMDGYWWDICGEINISEDYVGELVLWDTDYTKTEPMVTASISLNEAGTGEYGTVMSEGGWFMTMPLEHADWIVDPGLMEYPDMIHINGYFEDGEHEFTYDIFLRPWGTYWDDVNEEERPFYYNDWYLPLIDSGAAMPDSIGEGAPTGSSTDNLVDGGNTGTTTPSGDVPGGDGIISDEAVQKGYVYMSEVAKDIFHTTYEELAEYFGVDGQFVKEEYSDHMQVNKRYYKWISSENSNNFIYVNFEEREPGVFTISAFNTSGFSGTEAVEKYLDIVKAEAAEADRSSAASAAMKDFSLEIKDSISGATILVSTTIPESGWSTDNKDSIVENEDPTAFGAGAIRFKLRESMEKLESSKDSYKNLQEIEDRVIGGITFKGRTYEYIGWDWIEYVAQIDEGRYLSVALTDLDCFEGTMPDVILNNMTFQ